MTDAVSKSSGEILEKLSHVLAQRKQADPASSYVASLHAAGINKILEKLGEESIETIIAAKDIATSGNKMDLIKETADLWFHSMVMLSHLDIDISEIFDELDRRFDTSGLAEKAARSNSSS